MRAAWFIWLFMLFTQLGCADYEIIQKEVEVPAGDTHADLLGYGKKKRVTRVLRIDKRTGRTWVLRGSEWQPEFSERTWQQWWDSLGKDK